MTNLTDKITGSESSRSFVIDAPIPVIAPSPPRWRRFAIGGSCLALALGAALAGFSSIYYRLTHLTVGSAIVNGRMVRVQAPIDGVLQDFYGRSGVPVQAGQVLATLEPLPQANDDSQQLAGLQKAVDVTALDLELAEQMLVLLTEQEGELQRQDEQLQATTVAIAGDELRRYQALLDEAMTRETSTRAEYERYQMLFQEGAVSEQQRDQFNAEWQAAQALVESARAELSTARTTLGATQNRVPVQSSVDDVQERQQTLQQRIQSQVTRVEQLRVELAANEAERDRFQSLYGDEAMVQVIAPFTGVIYTTGHEAGEQVSRPATLLTVVDCRDLWVETLVRLDQANRIDADMPVRVTLAGGAQTLTGEVAVVEAMSMGALTEARTDALLPSVPPNLVGEPIARVRVNIPPMEHQSQAHQLCGLGQSAELTFGMQGW
ncbi:MAG: HlyD family efflux transporter periplasmic adaptor subunit [Cyanobacteria bacterium J06638_22]